VGYRKQRGPGIDLDLLTASTKFKLMYRQLYTTIGIDLYRRIYIGDETNFHSIYLQLTRKF
ncbi:MAG: hypothetical protein K8R53_13065, partial [Bacteroidales bacterium]|nr:hypothetical protein [Bacteroidales bacterium]